MDLDFGPRNKGALDPSHRAATDDDDDHIAVGGRNDDDI